MKIAVMTLEDVKSVIPLYINYYNTHEGSCWTEETTQCRITQVITMNGSYSLIMRDDEDNAVGFVMGYFKQYDDIVGYAPARLPYPSKRKNQNRFEMYRPQALPMRSSPGVLQKSWTVRYSKAHLRYWQAEPFFQARS